MSNQIYANELQRYKASNGLDIRSKNITQSVAISEGIENVLFQNIDESTKNQDISYDSDTGIFTVNKSGIYSVTYSIDYSILSGNPTVNTTDVTTHIILFKQDSFSIYLGQQSRRLMPNFADFATNNRTLTGSATIQMLKDEMFSIQVINHDTVNTIQILASPTTNITYQKLF